MPATNFSNLIRFPHVLDAEVDLRRSRIAFLRAQIARGRYGLDPSAVARALDASGVLDPGAGGPFR